jgi:hypothetical protein
MGGAMNTLGYGTDQILNLTSRRLKLDFNKVFSVGKITKIIYVSPGGEATVVSSDRETKTVSERRPYEELLSQD